MIEPRTAYESVAGRLRSQIVDGTFSPGSRLPTDAELRTEFGVGQSTIREALRTLASEHLVKSVRGVNGGTFVTIPTVGHMGSQLEVGMTLMATADSITINDLMEIRHITEVPAAGYAASRRTDEDIEALKSSDPGLNDQASSFLGHSTFHRRIVEAAHNPLLEIVTIPLFNALRNIVGDSNAAVNIGGRVNHDHGALLQSIIDRDSMGAMNQMRSHLDALSIYYRGLSEKIEPPSVENDR